MDRLDGTSITPGLPHLANEREAADALGISAATLAKWRALGKGPPFLKIGRRVLYDASDLRAYLASARRGAA